MCDEAHKATRTPAAGVSAGVAMKTPVDVLVVNASELITCRARKGRAHGERLAALEIIRDGALAISRDRIVAVGPTAALSERFWARTTVDARGRLVSPGFVDAHTHLVHAPAGSAQWLTEAAVDPSTQVRRVAERTRAATLDDLITRAVSDLDTMLRHGTTTVEAKSGYGLNRRGELRLLAIISQLRHAVTVVPTYLGGQVVRADHGAHVDRIIDVLPEAVRYAEYFDAICDQGGFSAKEYDRLARAAVDVGFRLRVHADSTADAGAVVAATALGASSVDHLDAISDAGVAALGASDAVGVLLPSVTYHLMETTPGSDGRRRPRRKQRPAWARRLVESDATLALATGYNPISAPSLSMQSVAQLAARLFRLSYSEIWYMCTINGAAALDRAHDVGSLEAGKRADVVVWRVSDHTAPIFQFGTNMVDTVIAGGEFVVSGDAIRQPFPR